MLAQSCEDRVGHWLYPIQPYNAGYNPKLHSIRVDAFPNQYRAFDQVLGKILQYVDKNTYLFIISDHGIKPLREFEESRRRTTQPTITAAILPSSPNTTLKMVMMCPGLSLR